MSVATGMMAAYIDSIPITLEEAAWIDGASLFGGFRGSSCELAAGCHVNSDLHVLGVVERPRRGVPADPDQ